MDNQAYKTIITGQIAGVVNAERFPSVPCSKVTIKALAGNSTNAYIGYDNSVTTATGFQLDAGQEIELNIDNLNKLWLICDAVGDRLCYIVSR